MAPSPENDNTPKAPDKNDKIKGDKHTATDVNKEKNKDFKTLNNLNDCELKDLLDEAITYKNPKDREGKSTLFKELLSQAEESERNARAASAGGSEQVRYCNTSAKRSKHRRKPNSISENVMHGGSLDNLAKEELFEVSHNLNRPKRTVSARQREGGSLPSNVNAGSLASYDPHFLEEARRKRTVRGGAGPPEPMDVDMESASLLEHDSVSENFDRGASTLDNVENASQLAAPKFTTKATLQVNVDDALHISDLDTVEKKPYEGEQVTAKVVQSKYSVYIQNYNTLNEAPRKVDENGNALHQNATAKGKKKKVQADKNVVSCVAAEKVEGHRSDIINDVNKLLEYIGEPEGKVPNKTNAHRANKHPHKNAPPSEEGGPSRSGGKKQRSAQSTKGKDAARPELKKSNSMGEISTAKLESFDYEDDVDHDDSVERGVGDDEVVMRAKKESPVEKPRERRSWGNVEPQAMQNFYKHPSTENIETASSSDFRVVTKKKKTKKRRSSVSGSRRKPSSATASHSARSEGDRAASPDPRRKSACSVPHSERSNDSSDVDSVHSLPIDTSQRTDSSLNCDDAPISYADIARNTERNKQQQQQNETLKKSSPESSKSPKETSPQLVVSRNDSASPELTKSKTTPHSLPAHASETSAIGSPDVAKTTAHAQSQTTPPKAPPPDVHNIRSFPAIQPANNKLDRPAKTDNKSNNIRGGNNKLHQHQGRQHNMVQSNNVANVNRNVRNQGNALQQRVEGHQLDIQNDLSIIQANEIDTIQYNSQIMPTIQIPDVQTIEKLHFMNQPGAHMPPHLQQHVVPPQHIHMTPPPHAHHHHHGLPMMPPMAEMYANGRPPTYTALISHTPHHQTHGGLTYVKASQAYEGVGVSYSEHAYLPPKGGLPETIGGNNVRNVVPNSTDNQNVRNLVTATTQTSNVETRQKSLGSNKSIEEENSNSSSSKPNKSKYSKKSNNPGAERNRDVPDRNRELSERNRDFSDRNRDVSDRNRDVPVSISPTAVPYTRGSSHHVLVPPTSVIAHSDAPYEGVAGRSSAPRRGVDAEPSTTTRDDLSAASNCDNRTNHPSECACSSEDSSSESRPPVVILSGSGNREVTTDLVFGFELNEELLSNDICEDFEQRFVPPPTFTETSHNHEKIVNYMSSAWDDIMESGEAVYYSDTLE